MELDLSSSSPPAEAKVEAEAWELIPSFSCSEDKVKGLNLGKIVGAPPGFRSLGKEPRVWSPLQDEANWHEEERLNLDLIRTTLPQPEVEESNDAIEVVDKAEGLEDKEFTSLEDDVSLPFFQVNSGECCREGWKTMELMLSEKNLRSPKCFLAGYNLNWQSTSVDSPASPLYLPTSPQDSLPSYSPIPTEMSFGEVYASDDEVSLVDKVFGSPKETLDRTEKTFREGLAEALRASLESFIEDV
jgi:hypothetical protein